MLYKNKKTGNIADLKSKITSEDWECLDALPNSCKKPRKRKKADNNELCDNK